MAHQHQADGWSQARERRPMTLYDDHGRPWFTFVELRSGAPVGHWSPQFWAPWYPDQAFFRQDPQNPTRFTIGYERLLQQAVEAHKAYHDRAVEEAASRKWPLPSFGEPIPYELQVIIGKLPHPPEIIVAAMQGNPWILGAVKKPDPRLEKLVPKRGDRVAAALAQFPDFSTLPDDRTSKRPAVA